MKKFKIIVDEVPGFLEIEAKDETDAVLRARMGGMTVRTILSVEDAPAPADREEKDDHQNAEK